MTLVKMGGPSLATLTCFSLALLWERGWVGVGGSLLACMHAFIHAPSLERAALRRSMSLILAGWLVRRDHTVTQMTKSPQNRKAEKLLPSL